MLKQVVLLSLFFFLHTLCFAQSERYYSTTTSTPAILSAARTITLPASPQDGDIIVFYVPTSLSNDWYTDVAFTKPDGTTASTLSANSKTILQYDGANSLWRAEINL